MRMFALLVIFWLAPLLAMTTWMLPGISFLREHQLIPGQSSAASLLQPMTRQKMLDTLLALSRQKEATALFKVRQELSPDQIHTNCRGPSLEALDAQTEAMSDFVRDLTVRGLVVLYPSRKLLPEREASRFEMAAAIHRLRHFIHFFELCLRSGVSYMHFRSSSRSSVALPFKDIPRDHWAYADVAELHEQAILLGISPDRFGGRLSTSLIQLGVALSRFF